MKLNDTLQLDKMSTLDPSFYLWMGLYLIWSHASTLIINRNETAHLLQLAWLCVDDLRIDNLKELLRE